MAGFFSLFLDEPFWAPMVPEVKLSLIFTTVLGDILEHFNGLDGHETLQNESTVQQMNTCVRKYAGV